MLFFENYKLVHDESTNEIHVRMKCKCCGKWVSKQDVKHWEAKVKGSLVDYSTATFTCTDCFQENDNMSCSKVEI